MPTLDMSKDERLTLIDVLESAISDLGAEIADTKLASYRNGLKDTKQSVMAILKRLQADAE